MSVREWGEYIAYGDEEVRVARSYRIYNERGELVSTGIEWESEKVEPGERPEKAVERARKRLDKKMEKIRKEVEEKYKGKKGPRSPEDTTSTSA